MSLHTEISISISAFNYMEMIYLGLQFHIFQSSFLLSVIQAGVIADFVTFSEK